MRRQRNPYYGPLIDADITNLELLKKVKAAEKEEESSSSSEEEEELEERQSRYSRISIQPQQTLFFQYRPWNAEVGVEIKKHGTMACDDIGKRENG